MKNAKRKKQISTREKSQRKPSVLASYRLEPTWTVFAPFAMEDGVPDGPDLRRIPEILKVAKKTAAPVRVPASNRLDLAVYLGQEPRLRKVAFVYIPFAVEKSGQAVFGLGADWWYQAWIDGRAMSDTLVEGNEKHPPSPWDHPLTLDLPKGEHLLVIRFISGSADSSVLCVGEDGEVLLSCLHTHMSAQPLKRAKTQSSICIDFEQRCGAMKPLNGVNNGPVYYDAMLDVSRYYREIGVPSVRLHDCNWPGVREVDIPQIFRDFDADPDDPASYDFRRTDDYLKSIVDTGAKVIYRLGVSIEHTARKYHIHPPKDFAHWSRICAGIVRHYNQGWANGFHYDIRHWEVWNEPSNKNMWLGTMEQYHELYAITARTLKRLDPSLKIGGPVYVHLPESERFLRYCRDHRVPLDFYVWHWYGNSLDDFVRAARAYKAQLEEFGFQDIEVHVTEWNFQLPDDPLLPVFGKQGVTEARKKWRECISNEVGASFVAAALILMQDEAVDGMNYYDGAPSSIWCGLFDLMGVPQKPFYAFKIFREMLNHPQRVLAKVVHDAGIEYRNLACLAGIHPETGNAAVMVSQYVGRTRPVTIELNGGPVKKGAAFDILILDRHRDLQLIATGRLAPGQRSITVLLRDFAVALIRFQR
jgi:hypothetical protein